MKYLVLLGHTIAKKPLNGSKLINLDLLVCVVCTIIYIALAYKDKPIEND